MLGLLGGGAAVYLWSDHRAVSPAVDERAASPSSEAKREGPTDPFATSQTSKSAASPAAQVAALPELDGQLLPALPESDATLADGVNRVLGKSVRDLLITRDLARNFVATVDNLPRHKLPPRLLPVKAVPGQTAATGEGTSLSLAPTNYSRYKPYVKHVKELDTPRLVALYFHFYPLFQQAYEELGYPKKQFNDRLIEVIDDLIAAPQPSGPISLVRPKVMYEFADADLEELSAGQKILVRMGGENAEATKTKLREIRSAIARQDAQGAR